MTGTDVVLLELSELLPWLVASISVLGGGAVFWRLRTKAALQQFQWQRRQQALEAEVALLRGTLAKVSTSLDQVEQQAVKVQPLQNGMNLTRRSQAIRMFKHGEGADQIAAALAVPRNEVELLIKIHQTMLKVHQ